MDSRYVSAPEAIWRLNGYSMYDQSHSIIRLAVHLKNMQPLYFQEGNEIQAIRNAEIQDTTLTAWFKVNKENEHALEYLYAEIPEHFVFMKTTTKWKPRQ